MKMSVNLSLFFSFFLVIHNANAFNITQILSQYPDFSTFNSYLTQTNLVVDINRRQTITVLAVENSNLAPISGKPVQVLKNILSVHVILDYFDVPKLQKLSNQSAVLTTLFQTTGLARGQQGFVNVTHLSTDSIAFASAVTGSTLGSNLIKSIASEPYNISVLQVSNVIIPRGIDDARSSPSPSGAPSASPSVSQIPSVSPDTSPRASPSTAPPTPTRVPAPSGAPSIAEVPAGAGAVTPAATPGSSRIPNAPNANAPATDAPIAGAPVADAPTANAPVADKTEKDSPSAGTTLHIGLAVVFTMVLSTLCLASRI